ncbi:MAG: SCO family protein [Cardiobacteriaceae bacterium]|nr:SCO family protein [Cardiobacteriaceae bacterium]
MAQHDYSSRALNPFRIGAFITLILAVALVCWYLSQRRNPLGEPAVTVTATGGDFKLQSANGEVSLATFHGKILVLYFGFIDCKAACPESMGTLRQALLRMNDNERSEVRGLFVSLEPDKDSLKDLAAFARYYHPNVVGATADTANLRKMAHEYGAYFQNSDLDDSRIGYTTDHSSRFYIINREGKLVAILSHSTTPNELIAKIREILSA